MKILITGGCGFLGSNLAHHALQKNYELVVFDNLSRLGSVDNLAWLKTHGDFKFTHGDIRNSNDITRAISEFKPDVIFHLAGQVAMTTSITNPRLDFEVNVLGSFNLLEAVRLHSPKSIVVYSSTNKVYGDLEQFTYVETDTRYKCIEKPNGFGEDVCLDFHSPYGVSKGSADQYMLDYARIFGIKTVVFRHSSMYGGRQFATTDQGWIGWFCTKALESKNNTLKEKFTISGNGKQVRDVLHADDMVKLYYGVIEQIEVSKGQAFNIGGGIDNSLSLLELFNLLNKKLSINLSYVELPPRDSDQRVFVADISKANQIINWKPTVSPSVGVDMILSWLDKNE